MIKISDYLDPFRPYLQLIKILGYLVIVGFLFVSGCNHGKNKQAQALAEAEQATKVCLDANQANLKTIEKLKQANKDFAEQALADKKKADKLVKEWQIALERSETSHKRTKQELTNAYKKNKEWADGAVPADVVRLLDKPRKD